MPTLAPVIEDLADRQPDALAFATGDRHLSWSAYARRSDTLAALLLDLGHAPAERVAVLLPDGPGVHIVFVATEKAGVVAVGIGPRAGTREIEHLLATTGAVTLISRRRYRDLDTQALVEDLRARGLPLRHHICVEGDFAAAEPLLIDGRPGTLPSPDPGLAGRLGARSLGATDLWLLNSTSGTTGMPKCVRHDQARWFFFHELAVRAGALSSDDVFLSAVPAPFGFGLWTAHFTPTLLGAPTVVLERFTAAETLAAMERHGVSVLAAVSTQFMLLLDDEDFARRDLGRLRVLFTGGEKVPYARAADFEERTGAHVLQFYGSNETGALSGTSLADSREKRLTTAGRTIAEMQVRLFDDRGRDVTARGRGQPGCKGGTLSQGYYRDEEANRALIRDDGWFLVGDLVRIDDEGYLTVEGRIGDFIIRGGKNVSAAAVEEAVESHPDVRVAAAVAWPDPTFGERVCAYVELREGRMLELDGLIAHLEAAGCSRESLPERLIVLDELPRSSGGKIAKKVLRDDAAQRAAADA